MNLVQLRYLVEVAEQGSMTRAARRLQASQPAISSAIKSLEEELETTLFNRETRGVSLTAAGRKVLDMAQEIFERIDRTRSELLDLEEELVGDFSVGCNEALGTYFLPDFLRQFLGIAPRIQVSIWNADSAKVRDAVVERRIDFGIVVNPEPHADLVIRRLFRDGIMAFVSAEEPKVASLAEARARVKRGPMVAARRIGPVREILARLDAEGVLPERIFDCGDLHLVRTLTASGLGVGLLPQRVALIRPDLVPLHPDLPGYPDVISLLYRADLHRTQGAMRLKNALVEYGEELQATDPTEGSIAPPVKEG